MKREPRITLPIKKPAKVDKLEPQWRLWIWYFLVTLLVLWVWQELANQVEYRTIPYSEFRAHLAKGEVAGALVKQNEIDGGFVPKPEGGALAGQRTPGSGRTIRRRAARRYFAILAGLGPSDCRHGDPLEFACP